MTDQEPAWLTKARSFIGFQEQAGNRGIQEFIDLAHTGEEGQPWCAIFANGMIESVGIRGTRSPAAASFTESPLFIRQKTPQLGTICTFTRPGGNHVAFYTGIDKQGRLLVLGGNQGDKVDIEPHGTDTLTGYWWPAQAATTTLPATVDHPLIAIGSTGPAVLELQRLLKVPATGQFDAATDAAVRQFQASRGLDIDGEVGPLTWGALLAATATGRPFGLTRKTIDAIVALAGASELARHDWGGRGVAPLGCTKGLAVVYGLVYSKLKAGDSSALAMGAMVPASSLDALEWYQGQFNAAGILLNVSAVDNLRATFVLLTGLTERESSGRYCEGRDQSATNVESDTCEAGLFQQSWNSHTASPEITKLFKAYSANPQGFLDIFREGVTPRAGDLDNFGSGDGEAFQALCKSCPAFAVEAAAVGLRVLRTHWGPINRHEAEISPLADALYKQVQTIVDAQPIEGDVIPPVKPLDDDLLNLVLIISQDGDTMDANLQAQILTEIRKANPANKALLLQALGGAPAPSPPAISAPSAHGLGGIDLSQIGSLLMNPTIKKVLGGQPVTLAELLPLIPTAMAMLQGHAPPPPPPGATVIVEPPPATGMSDTAFNWSTGIGASLTALLGSAAGVIGTPIPGSPDFSITGLLSFAVPLIAGAFGVPAPVASMIGNVFKGFKK